MAQFCSPYHIAPRILSKRKVGDKDDGIGLCWEIRMICAVCGEEWDDYDDI